MQKINDCENSIIQQIKEVLDTSLDPKETKKILKVCNKQIDVFNKKQIIIPKKFSTNKKSLIDPRKWN